MMAIDVYPLESFRIIHKTKVDFGNRGFISIPVNLVQYDTVIPVIAIELYLNNKEYKIPIEPEPSNIKIRWTKKDKEINKDILGHNSERNIIYVAVDEEMSYYPGNYSPIIEMIFNIGGVEARVGSSSFNILIDRNPIQN